MHGRTGLRVSDSRRHGRPNGAELSQLQRRWCVPRRDANRDECVTQYLLIYDSIVSVRVRRRYLLLQARHKPAEDPRHGDCRAVAAQNPLEYLNARRRAAAVWHTNRGN